MLEYGRKMCLYENFLLQGLTDGLKYKYKSVFFVNPQYAATEC